MWLTIKDESARWKILLALLLGTFLAGMILSLSLAAQRVKKAADADYYSHGLRYGRTASGSSNAGLGWTISPSLTGADLQVRVRDESGAPVSGGELNLEPERKESGLERPLRMAETSPGVFQGPRPFSLRGELHGTLRFTRGDAFASQKLVLFN